MHFTTVLCVYLQLDGSKCYRLIKDEFYLDQCFTSIEHARVATKNAIKIYNEKRLHVSLGYKTPESVFEYQVNLNV